MDKTIPDGYKLLPDVQVFINEEYNKIAVVGVPTTNKHYCEAMDCTNSNHILIWGKIRRKGL